MTLAPARFVSADKFRDCVHCGLCLNACPTYVELGTEMDSPRGRIYLMERLESGELPVTPDVVRHLDLCLGCRACETACPSGVQYGELIEAARGYVESRHGRPLGDRIRRRLIAAIFPYPGRLRRLLAPLRLLERLGWLSEIRRRSEWAAMLPRLDAPVRSAPEVGGEGESGRRVSLFAGCVAQVLFPGTHEATRRVLRRNRYALDEPATQTCCGALHLHAGDPERAREWARRNISAFHGSDAPIVVTAAGCGAMMKEYGHLLRDDPAWAGQAAAFSARVRDVTEHLAEHSWEPPREGPARRVTYHDACHLAHGQGVRQAPRDVLRAIPGLELVEMNEADFCCGSAGSYNLTEPEMARRLGERKAANIGLTGVACVAAGNPGCAMQIQAALRRVGNPAEVLHPIEILDRAYREGDRRTPPKTSAPESSASEKGAWRASS